MTSQSETQSHAAEMYDLIEKFGRGVTDMFEQMIRGKWADDHGHDVRMNAAMVALQPLITEAIELRAAIARARGSS